jgi:hypothetical protein
MKLRMRESMEILRQEFKRATSWDRGSEREIEMREWKHEDNKTAMREWKHEDNKTAMREWKQEVTGQQ